MRPSQVSSALRQIDDLLASSEHPSLSLVKNRLATLLLATDRSFAQSVRDSVLSKVVELLPGEFNGELYDTNPGGKGFQSGYISFGLDPQTWENDQIIGGILFKMKYDQGEFKSEAPDGEDPESKDWKGHSKGEALVEIEAEAGYYNKKIDGSYSEGRPLGDILVHVDAREQVVEVEFTDPGSFKTALESLISDIQKDPPAYAQSAARKKKDLAPTSSPKALLQWVKEHGQGNVVWGSQINELARGIAAQKDMPFQNALQKVTEYFTSRGFTIEHNK